MKKSCTIEYLSIKLSCEGDYYKGTFGGYEEPPEASEFEMTKIFVEDSNIDLTNLFYELNILGVLEELAIDAIEDA